MDLATFTQEFATTEKKRLLRFLSIYTITAFVFGGLFGLVAIGLSDLATGLNAGALIVHGLVLAFARGRVSQDGINTLIYLVCASTFVLGSIFVLLQPFMFIALMLTSIIITILALPFVLGDRLRVLMFASGVSSIGALACGVIALQGWQLVPSNLAPAIQLGFNISSSSAMIGLLLLLLWQFHGRMFDLVQTVQQTNIQLTDRNDELHESNKHLQAQLDRESALVGLVTELEIPITRIADGVLLSSLIGYVDERRAIDLNEKLLTAVHQHRARYIILDISGMKQLDSQVAQLLITMMNGVTLIGCSMMISGISAQIAITLVQQGIGFDKIATYPTIEEALDTIQHSRTKTKDTTIWSSHWGTNGHTVEDTV